MENNVSHKAEIQALNKVLDRAEKLQLTDRLSLLLDISYSNVNVIALAEADEATFTHDVIGIYNHFDRDTKMLAHCFVPRVGFKK